MEKFVDGSYQSAPGPALIAKVLAGRCKMNYTRAAVGAGTIPEGESPKTMQEPPGYVMDAKISAITNPVDGECQVTVQINSSDVEEGFYLTSIILYAADPDDGEVPYTYLMLEEGPEWIRPSSAAVGKLATFDLVAAVGAVDKVSANIDPNSIVTRNEAQRLIAAATAKVEITIPKTGWQNGQAEGYNVLYLDIPVDDMKESMIPMLSVYPEAQTVAKACQLGSTAQTLDGKLRLFAKEAPSEDIGATLTLFCSSVGAVSSEAAPDGSYVLPVATETKLGGVRVGEGPNVSPDGTLSVNQTKVMTDSDLVDEGEVAQSVAAILNEGEA